MAPLYISSNHEPPLDRAADTAAAVAGTASVTDARDFLLAFTATACLLTISLLAVTARRVVTMRDEALGLVRTLRRDRAGARCVGKFWACGQ
tara:strand:- start:195 stop:470 length:276 start_codon:yes stop_codon:yes gene_type:complete